MGTTSVTTPFLTAMENKDKALLPIDAAALEASRNAAQPGYAQREFVRGQQQGFFENLGDGIASTSAFKAIRYADEQHTAIKDYLGSAAYNGQKIDPNAPQWEAFAWGAAIYGFTADDPSYDPQAHAAELTTGVPVEYWDDILAYGSLKEAQAARARILYDTERDMRMASQQNVSSKVAMLAGSFIDADLPLVAMSGGYYGAVKTTRAAYKAARVFGIGSKGAGRVASVVDGMAAGAQAGALLSAVDAVYDDRASPDLALTSILMGTTTGGALGAFINPARLKVVQEMRAVHAETMVKRPLAEIDTELDARAMDDAIDLNPPMDTDMIETPGPQPVKSINAARVPTHAGVKDPLFAMLPETKLIIERASDWMDRTGARSMLADLDNTVWGKIVMGHYQKLNGLLGSVFNGAQNALTRAIAATGNDVRLLYKSQANTANWFAMNILESPTSYGRGIVSASAAALDAMAERRIGSTVLGMGRVVNTWAKRTGNTMQMLGAATGLSVRPDAAKSLYREVMLNLNDIRMGRAPRSMADSTVMELVGMVQKHGEESLKWLQGYGKNSAVKGTENLQYDPGYVPQRANGSAMVNAIREGRTTREAIEAAFTAGYMAAGLPQDIAEKIARANVGRAMRRDLDVDTSLIDLLQEDGRGFLKERLEMQGLSAQEVDQIMTHLTGMQSMAGQPGFTKHRNDLDMDISVQTLDGSDMRIVDFMDHDLPNMLQRYRKGVSGAGALAKKGIRSRKDRDAFIEAIQQEQRALGEEPMHTDKIKAILSDFDAGPSHGYANGNTNKGIALPISIGKQIANLSLLSNLGFSQLIDSANVMAADGFRAWRQHTRAQLGFDKALQQVDSELVDDLSVLMGDIGHDHHMFREHVHLDEVTDRDAGPFIQGLRKMTNNMSYIQGFTSMFNQIRAHQQHVGSSVLANKVIRAIREGTHVDRIRSDFGISEELQGYIKSLIDDGTIEFTTVGNKEFVNRLNPHKWDVDAADDFGGAMVRGQDTLIMRNLPGETDVWMRSNWGTLVTHLKMFPLTAIPKQMMRNARFMDQQTMGSLMFGMATAYVVMKMRDAITGKERSEKEQILNAIGYSNMMGWIPMAWDPAMTMLGLDDYRMMRYGRYYEATVPTVEVANRLWRAPGAALNLMGGNHLNGDDKQALLAIPFLRTLGIGEWAIDSVNPPTEAEKKRMMQTQ